MPAMRGLSTYLDGNAVRVENVFHLGTVEAGGVVLDGKRIHPGRNDDSLDTVNTVYATDALQQRIVEGLGQFVFELNLSHWAWEKLQNSSVLIEFPKDLAEDALPHVCI